MPKHGNSILKPIRRIQPNLTAYSWSGLRATLHTFPSKNTGGHKGKAECLTCSALMKALALFWADSLEWEVGMVGKVSDDKAHTHPMRHIWATFVSHLICS